MKIFKRVALVLGILIALILIVSLFLPSKYKVERSATVNAPPDSVYAMLVDLKEWARWSPWQKNDPAMKLTYSPTTAGAGAWQEWQSKDGDGKLTITEAKPAIQVSYEFEMKDWGNKSLGEMKLTPEGAGTKVTWTMSGDLGANPLSRYFGLFMDDMVGKDFEKGLANIEAATKL